MMLYTVRSTEKCQKGTETLIFWGETFHNNVRLCSTAMRAQFNEKCFKRCLSQLEVNENPRKRSINIFVFYVRKMTQLVNNCC